MKAIFCFLFFVSNISSGQTNVEGNIGAFPNKQYSIRIDQSLLDIGKLVAEGTTDDKGRFNVSIDIKREQPIVLFVGNLFFSLWAKPNTTVGILENPGKQYSFFGAAAIENNILFQSGLMQPYKTAANIGLDFFNPGKQTAHLDSIEKSRLKILNAMHNNNVVSEAFRSYYKSETYGYTFFNKNQYPAMLKAANKITDSDIPNDYFSFWSNFELDDDSTASNSYQNALQNYIEYIALRKVGKDKRSTEQALHEMFRTADSLLQNYPLSLQKQKTSYLILLIKYFNLDNLVATEMDFYRKQFPQSSSLSLLENLWNKKQGSASTTPSFQLKNTRGELVDIKDFRGKVVYIDFWGSWCKACLMNMAYAQKLKDRFKNKSVVFIYIDFFDTDEKWTTAIKKNNIEGIHLKAEKSDEEYFNKVFNIDQGFPKYALIDKKGKLVTISAPPPQDQSVSDFIQKHLDE